MRYTFLGDKLTRDLVKRLLPEDEVEQMEHRYEMLYSSFPMEGAPNLQEMLAEATLEEKPFMRREILLGGVLWYRRNEEAKSEKHRWLELSPVQRDRLEDVFQVFYAEKEG